MGFDSTWPAILCLAAWAWIAHLVRLPRRGTASAGPPRRLRPLDGLRGFLALSVFLWHSALTRSYVATQDWHPTSDRFVALMAVIAVYLFFMITGFLFWGQLLRSAGRMDWRAFYIGRLFRIAPVYLVAVCFVFVIIGVRSRWQLQVPPLDLAQQLATWLTLGLLTNPPINAIGDPPLLLAGVTWTLHFEWLFYLSLPLLAFGARDRRMALPFVAVIFTVGAIFYALNRYVLSPVEPQAVTVFATGMIVATLQHSGRLMSFKGHGASWWIVALLATIFLNVFHSPLITLCLIGGCFYFVVCGGSLFGLLESRGALRLGAASYGIYLLQGVVFSAIALIRPLTRFVTGTPLHYWVSVLLSGVVLVAIAGAVHVVVELPGMRLGKRLLARFSHHHGGGAARTPPARDASPSGAGDGLLLPEKHRLRLLRGPRE